MSLAMAQWIGAAYVALCAALSALTPVGDDKSSPAVRRVRVILLGGVLIGVFALIALGVVLRHFRFMGYMVSGTAVLLVANFVKAWRNTGSSRSTVLSGGCAGCCVLLAIASFVRDIPLLIALFVAAMVILFAPFAVFAIQKRRGKQTPAS